MKIARWISSVCATVLCAAALSACSSVEPGGGSAQPEQAGDNVGRPAPANVTNGGTLTIALASEPDKLDPTVARSLVGRQVFHAMCEKLYDLDENVKIVPQLATALPSTSADGLTVTIPVREGIKFADGTAFDANAVKKSLDRHLSMKTSVRKSEMGPITKVEATDAKTVVVTLSKPFAPLTAALADRAGMVMSPKQLDALGDNFSSNPVCVGPFKFAKRVPQTSIELVKDPAYYAADKVHFEKLVYRIITDGSIRFANLRSGDIQVGDTISTQDAPSLKRESALELLEVDSLGYQGLTVNVGNVDGVRTQPKAIDRPLAKDPRVRQALELAINRQEITKSVFNGFHRPACSPISAKTQYTSDRAQQCRSHNAAEAKRLLQEAGVPVPFPIKLSLTNTPDNLRLGQAIQAMVKQGGFDMTLEPVEFATLLDQQDAGKYELLQIGWSGRVDPDANMTSFVKTLGSQNVAGYSNPAVDDLLDRARTQQDPSERAKTYAEAIEKLQQDNPLIYLYRQRNLTGVARKAAGVQVFADGIIRVAFAGYLP